jgi:hypothetical protein
MATYTGSRLGITPATTTDAWTLDAAASEVGALYFVEAGGEVTASAAMRTRWTPSSGAAGALTALTTILKTDPIQQALTNLINWGTPYASTQPTLDAGDWYAESWNAHGGLVRYQAGLPQDELVIVGAKTVSCRNVVGTSASTYICKWREF